MFFKAVFEYLNKENKVQSIDVVFEADDLVEAMRAPKRWWENRHKAAPEFFHEMGYVAVYPYTIKPINEDGAGGAFIGFRMYEWSQDRAGVDWDTFIEWQVAKLPAN